MTAAELIRDFDKLLEWAERLQPCERERFYTRVYLWVINNHGMAVAIYKQAARAAALELKNAARCGPKKDNPENLAVVHQCIENNKVNWKKVAAMLGIKRSTPEGRNKLKAIERAHRRVKEKTRNRGNS